ncbi:MAG: PhnD/SsuA/transferrin family substrate-binding protein [Pseudomonadota bacterium]
MIATLPMYDLPGVEAANDRYWASIAARLPGAPAKLDRNAGTWSSWMSPELIFSQTCGLPFKARLADKVTYIGTPDYGVPGCAPGWYTSVIIARRDEAAALDTGRFAFNDPMSQSGWNAPATLAAARGQTLNATLQSGSHMESLRAVAEERAEFAAIDWVTWRIFEMTERVPAHVVVMEQTDPTPGLPYIAGGEANPLPLRRAVEEAIVAMDEDDRRLLQLQGLVQIPLEDYLALPVPPPTKPKAL